ncbi:MAG: peptidoglycan DD-metalloendopeptidase family protein [Clostridia bacterium]|nr:peptidoglycan DD-metalloendopeptidase family protein [Clostridia bacterium]
MKKKKFRVCLIALALSAATIASCLVTPSSAAEGTDSKIASYEEQMNDLKKKQEEAAERINATQNDLSQAVDYKRSIDESLEITYQKMYLAENMIAELDVKIADKEAEILKQNEIIEDRREKFKKRMVSIADDGSFSYLSLLLSAGSVSEFLTLYDSVSSILAYDKRVMGELRDAKAALLAARDELEAAKTAQANTIDELHSSEAYFNDLSNSSQALINSLSTDKEELERTYAYYAAEEEKIAAELQELMKQREAEQPTVHYGDGTYLWPLDGFTTISSGFGYRNIPSYGLEGFHRGIDIPAPGGTPIRACNGGTVVRSEFHYSWGNYVLVDHGGGYSTLYAHMTTRYVSAGTPVGQGDVLGTVGQTGNAYGDHLHLEYWVNGELVDPTSLFY